ncbi:hypothetical protein [Embleya sp. NPDC050493]|uniref:hypothetical protein n=1 Tax=Embleya sp. NPDC050493 TaxID=3363989 RepID=UPI0037AA66F3
MRLRPILTTALLGAVVTATAVVPAQAATDRPDLAPFAPGKKCATLYAPNGTGSIEICWTWTKHAQGAGFYGSYWGKYHDNSRDQKHLILQAKSTSWNWGPVDAATQGDNAHGEPFNKDYQHLSGLTFRACISGGGCGSAP